MICRRLEVAFIYPTTTKFNKKEVEKEKKRNEKEEEGEEIDGVGQDLFLLSLFLFLILCLPDCLLEISSSYFIIPYSLVLVHIPTPRNKYFPYTHEMFSDY